MQGVGYGSRTAGHGQSGHAAFESCHAVLQHSLRGVGQTAVDVTGIAQSEAVGGVLRIAEHIRCGLVNRYCTGISSGVGLFLSYMYLECFKMEFAV